MLVLVAHVHKMVCALSLAYSVHHAVMVLWVWVPLVSARTHKHADTYTRHHPHARTRVHTHTHTQTHVRTHDIITRLSLTGARKLNQAEIARALYDSVKQLHDTYLVGPVNHKGLHQG